MKQIEIYYLLLLSETLIGHQTHISRVTIVFMKKTIKNVELLQKCILLRVDFNVPIENGKITDDFKIRSTIPTIRYLLNSTVKSLFIVSHLGRPRGRYDPNLSLKPIYEHIKPIFDEYNIQLEFRNFYETVGNFVFYENVRFLEEEENVECAGIKKFTDYIKTYCDFVVVDAFGVVHRKCASLVCTGLPVYAGLLIERELVLANEFLHSTEKFDLIILGGTKISDKIKLIINCVQRTKRLFIAGGMCFAFMRYNGENIGDSVCEEGLNDTIAKIWSEAHNNGTEIILPLDFKVQYEQRVSVEDKIVNGRGLDIGPKTIEHLDEIIKSTKRVFWNGPVGKFEDKEFENGTKEILESLYNVEKVGGCVIIGGGDTAYAVDLFARDKFKHVSTGGGSLLALLEGKQLPGIEIIEDM